MQRLPASVPSRTQRPLAPQPSMHAADVPPSSPCSPLQLDRIMTQVVNDGNQAVIERLETQFAACNVTFNVLGAALFDNRCAAPKAPGPHAGCLLGPPWPRAHSRPCELLRKQQAPSSPCH